MARPPMISTPTTINAVVESPPRAPRIGAGDDVLVAGGWAAAVEVVDDVVRVAGCFAGLVAWRCVPAAQHSFWPPSGNWVVRDLIARCDPGPLAATAVFAAMLNVARTVIRAARAFASQ